jgi:hypothetical protein
MQKNNRAVSWKDVNTVLSQKSTSELRLLIKDLYTLNTANKDFIHTKVLTTRKAPRRRVSTQTPQPQMPRSSKATSIIRRLANIAAELRAGAHFNITRLTTLKSLCEDSKAAAHFAFHIAQLTHGKMQEKDCPAHLEPERWEYCKQVVDETLRQMARYLEKATEAEADLLRAWLSDVRTVQDRYEQQAWGPADRSSKAPFPPRAAAASPQSPARRPRAARP